MITGYSISRIFVPLVLSGAQGSCWQKLGGKNIYSVNSCNTERILSLLPPRSWWRMPSVTHDQKVPIYVSPKQRTKERITSFIFQYLLSLCLLQSFPYIPWQLYMSKLHLHLLPKLVFKCYFSLIFRMKCGFLKLKKNQGLQSFTKKDFLNVTT